VLSIDESVQMNAAALGEVNAKMKIIQEIENIETGESDAPAPA